ncbi:MAG: hydantoinase/oxoprolinase family protein [Planktomarina sp.]|nr:hydantoinase/oxoprolinase family protein [Planktomarina sp.]|tara:strand:- start:52 stop:2130 length:2079 start_codon:yes stop_codon:yes gene_type:complete
MKYALAIDIGGTFTDAVLIRNDGKSWTDKTLSTHQDLLKGFFKAANLVLGKAGIQMKDIDDVIVHATTVVTNVLIERKGYKTALITTAGFKDVLYIRDEHRYDMFDPQIEYPDPLISREYTWGVDGRVYSDGSIGAPVNRVAVREVALQLLSKEVVSVAICLLNSYANPEHERQVREVINDVAPDIYVTLSSDISPEMREYRRTTTTAVNAYAVPITGPYLNALIAQLREYGVSQEPLIMLSNGGVIGARVAGASPVRMIESGPAAGALVAGYLAKKYGLDSLISFDMGGTTAKACIIQQGEPLIVGDFEVDRQYLFKPGSGMTVTVPSIDMIEIGAGGGSIARVDMLGLLKVGPDSAGSDPGPACYGRGGEDACVTDADVVLGILDANNFLGGDMQLKRGDAERVIQNLANRLGVSLFNAAFGIFSVVGESMAAAARAHATDRGVNYRGLPLLAFGGAGPVHACYVAERLDSTQVIYPPMASVLSAFGTLVTPARLDLVRGGLCRIEEIDWTHVDKVITSMLDEGQRAVSEAGIEDASINYEFAADMRYRGQQDDLTVALSDDPRINCSIQSLRIQFDEAYKVLYGNCLDDMDVELVCWRVTVLGDKTGRHATFTLMDTPAKPKSVRSVFFEDSVIDVPIYERAQLAFEQEIAGPVIIEERETTVFVLPNWDVKVHADGSLIATKSNQESL